MSAKTRAASGLCLGKLAVSKWEENENVNFINIISDFHSLW